MKDSVKRTILKTISWRAISTVVAVSLIYFYTRELEFSLAFGAADIVIKSILYYIHERVWA